MYVVRDVFHLKFGHYKDAKGLLDQMDSLGLIPDAVSKRVLTDFTGDAYRLILEMEHKSLGEYEQTMQSGMGNKEWKDWYEKFKEHVVSSHREILKLVS
jgi:hypothetical protein